MNAGDTAFLLLSAALIFIMIPGTSLFYGGLGSRKNLINNMMSCIVAIGIGAIVWLLVGYSASFGESICGIFGKINFDLFKNGFTLATSKYSTTVPNAAFVVFQMMFALLTPALIVGAIEGRMKFKSLSIFLILWSIIVYYPLVHMSWAQGGLFGPTIVGAVDFAGGNVIHVSSGITGLVLATLLGKRKSNDLVPCHNVPFVLIGTALLWFGWFGFSAGSIFQGFPIASHAFLATIISSSSAFLTWVLIDIARKKRAKLVSGCVGAIVGLVAITPAAGFVPIWSALIIGAIASLLSYFTVNLIKMRFCIDDAMDVFACHGVGGIWGGIATGIFADTTINPNVKPGLIFGEFNQLLSQLTAISITIIFTLAGTLVCAYLIGIFLKLRISEQEELDGLDLSQHEEEAYCS
ncbi:MAG: ammonium transporter [Oscillospiraceae bacterium]|nr:ammonium transporter [Oscillospiraceae bacterium]